MPHRWIFHVDMDAFFVSVEIAKNPELKGKPVIVGGNPDGRGVVTAASYEARQYGVHSAMPAIRAKRLCPQAIFLRGSHTDYQLVSDQVRAIFEDFTPMVEMVSIDEAYLDMTGFDRLYGPVFDTAVSIRNRIMEKTGCPASIGIATNKLVAKVSSEYAKPSGIFLVRPGCEASFFSSLSVDSIPGIGRATTDRLFMLGVKKVADLVYIGRDVLEMTMGKTGMILFNKAMGLGSEKLSTPDLPKSISNETTFHNDTVDKVFIESVFSYLTEKTATRMRQKNMRARKVSIKLRYSDFQTLTRDTVLPSPTDNDQEILERVLVLFRRAFTRRTRVRLVGVKLSSLQAGSEQLFLPGFQSDETARWQSVYRKVDEVRERYGFTSVLNAHSALSRKSPVSKFSRDEKRMLQKTVFGLPSAAWQNKIDR